MPRTTEEIVAQVMPVRTFGLHKASWAKNSFWPKLKRFPSTHILPLWRRMLTRARLWLERVRGLPRATKWQIATGAGVLLLLSTISFVLLRDQRQFVQQKAQLLAGPNDAEGEFGTVATLEPREPVEVLDQVHHLLLVRDSVGRVGYLSQKIVGGERPPATPEKPFTRCRRLPGEPDATACSGRAERQRTECTLSCSDRVDIAGCEGTCNARLDACIRACEGHSPNETVDQQPAAVTPDAAAKASEPPSSKTERALSQPTGPSQKSSPTSSRKKRKKRNRR